MKMERKCNRCNKLYGYNTSGDLLYFTHCSLECCEKDFSEAKNPTGYIPNKYKEQFYSVFRVRYKTQNI